MAYTQAQADAIREALATGSQSVRYSDGRQVTYRSQAEMRSLLADIEAELGLRPRRAAYTLAGHRKGL